MFVLFFELYLKGDFGNTQTGFNILAISPVSYIDEKEFRIQTLLILILAVGLTIYSKHLCSPGNIIKD